MRLALLRPLASCLMTVMTCLVGYVPSVQGVNFEQQEMEQSQFIAIARPYGNHQYDLLILQQIPGKQKCWSESGADPVTIEPLLLNFDFSGSCERSTDSNGYSIRIDGQDLGMDYLLRLVMRNDELLLIGTSRDNSHQPDVIVGRTNGVAPGLLKISLNPGWRFSKRAYQGKILGHVYLTGDSQAMTPINILNADIPRPRTSSPTTAIEPPHPPKELTFTAEGTQPQLPTPTLPENAPVAALPPPPLPSPPETSDAQPPLPPPLPRVASNPASRKTLSDTLDGLSGSPAPAPQAVARTPVQRRYRVIVAADDRHQVRSLYPDAFPTSYQGRSVLQIGVFSTQDKAQQALQSLTSAGIEGQIVPTP